MYELRPGGAYFGASMNGMAGLRGLGDVPPQYMPASDQLVADWCTAQGIPAGYCPYTPGMIDYRGQLHIVSDPTGQPCGSMPLGLGPCSIVDVSQGAVPQADLDQAGISLFPISEEPDSVTTPTITAGNGRIYFPLSSHPNAAQLTYAQTIALLNAMYQSPSTAPPPPSQNPSFTPIGQPAQGTSVQGTYSSPTTAAAIANQIPGATVAQTTTGQYQVMAPGDAVANPIIAASNPIVPAQTPAAGTHSTSGSTVPPAGNAQATPPSTSMFCFPGDTSGEIMSGVPVCQYTALGGIALLVLLAVAMK